MAATGQAHGRDAFHSSRVCDSDMVFYFQSTGARGARGMAWQAAAAESQRRADADGCMGVSPSEYAAPAATAPPTLIYMGRDKYESRQSARTAHDRCS